MNSSKSLIVTLLFLPLYSNARVIEHTFKASDPEKFPIEVRNASNDDIFLEIQDAAKNILVHRYQAKIDKAKGFSESGKGVIRFSEIDTNQGLYFTIFVKDKGGNFIQAGRYYLTRDYLGRPNERQRIYVTWEKNALRPQSGKSEKGKRVSQSGVVIDENVVEKEIQRK